MSETTRIERFKAHFGLTETPSDIGDDGQAFLDFVDAVLTSRTGPLNDLYNDCLSQIDKTGLSSKQIVGRLIDLLIVKHWGEEEQEVVNAA